eukprot:COSAG05_NODE_1248_length_5406_cov_2.854720_5_plen_39_part_01
MWVLLALLKPDLYGPCFLDWIENLRSYETPLPDGVNDTL